jgi:integrase
MAGRGIGLLPATWRTMRKPGLHADGNCLYLQITTDDVGAVRGRSWIFRYQRGARVRDMGLGSANILSLSETRELARQYRKLLLQGLDPIAERNAQVARNLAASTATMTFDEAAAIYIRQHRAGWKSPSHAAQWVSTLKAYASPTLGRMSVADITTAHIMKTIAPVWAEKTETAARVRGRIEAVLGWATVSGHRTGENPARWKGHLDNLLASRTKVRAIKHQPALPYAEMPAFMQELRGTRKGAAALALEFTVLTCVRSADVRNAKVAHIDRAARVWAIPALSKNGLPHRVPLSTSALSVFDKARKLAAEIGGGVGSSPLAFPNDVSGARLSENSMLEVLRRMGRKGAMTTHGCRASFRTWAQEQTNFPWEVCEMTLGHRVGDAVERAYARGDALRKRVGIMQAWADYLDRPQQPSGSKVVPLRDRSA